MFRKKMRQKICLLGVIAGVFIGSISVSAASYVGGEIDGSSCNGTIIFEPASMSITAKTYTLLAGVTCRTIVQGSFTRYGQELPVQSTSGTNSATISDVTATGFVRAQATHRIYYEQERRSMYGKNYVIYATDRIDCGQKSWGGGTDL